MGWKLSLAQRIRAGAALVVVFLLVLATNMMDNSHFKIVQKTLTTVYEDRLLAKDYIYKISRLLQIKKKAIQNLDAEGISIVNQSVNDSIQSLISIYAGTELTEKEAVRFESLKKNLARLAVLERNTPKNESFDRELTTSKTIEDLLLPIYADLDALSQIQLEESRREIKYSNRTIDTSNLISRIEIGVLIVIGVLIQMLIFIKPLK